MTPESPELDPAVAVDVLLESANEGVAAAAQQVQASLHGEVEELGLEGELRVRAETCDVPEHAVRLSVNGERFLLGGMKGELSAPIIARALHAERWAWVTGAGLRAVEADISTRTPAPQRAVLLAAGRQLAHRGVAITRLLEAAPLDDAEFTDPTALAETAMATTTAPLTVRVAPDDRPAAEASRPALDQLTEQLWNELGVVIPPIDIGAEPSIPRDRADIKVNDISLPVTWPLENIAAAASEVAAQYAGSLLTAQVVEYLLDQLATLFPRTTSAARSRMSVGHITASLRLLLDQGVSVFDLRAVVEGLCETLAEDQDASPADADGLVASAASRFGLMLIRRHVQDGTLSVFRVPPVTTDARGRLAEWAIARLHADIAERDNLGQSVILAPAQLAAAVRRAVRPRCPGALVVTPDDIPAGIELRTTGSTQFDFGEFERMDRPLGMDAPADANWANWGTAQS